MTTDYDLGFYDAVKFIATHIRRAADQVEKPVRGDVEGKEGKRFNVITRQGSPIYATRLRELADELERIITQ